MSKFELFFLLENVELVLFLHFCNFFLIIDEYFEKLFDVPVIFEEIVHELTKVRKFFSTERSNRKCDYIKRRNAYRGAVSVHSKSPAKLATQVLRSDNFFIVKNCSDSCRISAP